MGVCMCGGESERGPPCGCAAYMWICGIVCVVAGERERERGGGEGGGGGGEKQQQPFVKTTRQAQHTNRSTLEARRYHSSIHPKRLSEYVGFIRRSFSY